MVSLFHPARWLCALAMLCTLGVGSAIAQLQPSGIDLGRDRLLHQFDFEEADAGNFESMPRFWYVMGRGDQTSDPNFNDKPLHRQMIEREGFPRFTRVQFDKPQREKGEHSLHLGLNGGSAGAFLEVGALAAVPKSDYTVTARIKTSNLRNARARLIVYFVDAQGKRINDSAVATPLMTTREQWQNVTLKLAGDHDKAAWIGMQVELLQVQHQTPLTASEEATAPSLGKHAVQYQDNQGDAWFDDISVWQVPRIVVRTQSPVNLIVAPDKPLLTFEVRDLSGRKLNADVQIYNHRGQSIAKIAKTVGGGEPATWRWSPQLPALGWYLIDMTLRDPNDATAADSAEPVARTLRSFLWLPGYERTDSRDRKNFSIDLHGAGIEEMKTLPLVASATGVSSVIISAWDPDVTLATQDTRMAELDAIVQPLWRQGTTVSTSLAPLPRELAERLDIDPMSPVWLFAKPRKDWSMWINPLIIRHGQNVRRWHLGPQVGGNYGSPELESVIAKAVDVVTDLTPEPQVVLPWDLSIPRPLAMHHHELAWAMEVSQAIAPQQFKNYLEEWKQSPQQSLALTLLTSDATQMSQARRVDDLAMRMLHAWEAGVDGLTIVRPWDHGFDRFNALHPDPLLSVFASLTHQLDGRRVIGRLPLGLHGQAMILDGPRGPMLAAWLDGGSKDRYDVKLYLGENPIMSDVWGNAQKLVPAAGKHHFTLSSTPIFIEGIDAELALFRASFVVTPRMIESSQVTHEHTLTLRNPWPQLMQGELTILEPGRDWKIDPRRIPISIEPSAELTIPIKLSFPVAEVAGEKKLIARFVFGSGKRPSIDLEAPMEVGLNGIEMDSGLSFKIDPVTNQSIATATAFITNTGKQSRTMYVFAMCAGQPRQERIITLKPGQSLMRRFRFAGINAEIMKTPVRIGLRDTTGPALMNHVLRFDGTD